MKTVTVASIVEDIETLRIHSDRAELYDFAENVLF